MTTTATQTDALDKLAADPDDAAPTAPTAPAPTAPAGKRPGVGFVGCPRVGGLLRVRVAYAASKHQHMRVICPNGCGEHLTTDAMARTLLPGEDFPDLREVPPPEPPAPSPTALQGRQQISDAAIIAATPTDREVPLVELAETLGYSSPESLTRRMRRRNRRAEAKGEPPPFALRMDAMPDGRSGGRRLVVRRAVACHNCHNGE